MRLPEGIRRQPLPADGDAMVRVGTVSGAEIVTTVEPNDPEVALARWVSANRAFVDRLFARTGAVLFRGFEGRGPEALEAFARSIATGDLLEYRDRSTPRAERGDRIYQSTVYPPEQRIRLHNEGTYWRVWPRKLMFHCVTAPKQGGATPIADVRRVYLRIDPEVRARFEGLGVRYVRNYNDGFGLPWQEVFQTEDPAEVEAYAETNGITVQWKPGARLRTIVARPAVRHHPETRDLCWFNHAAFFHLSARDPAMRDALTEAFAPEELPFQTWYGDGAPIDPATVAHILAAYRAERARFEWRPGDLLLLDNAAVAHGREPYEGDREVLVAMADPCSGTVS